MCGHAGNTFYNTNGAVFTYVPEYDFREFHIIVVINNDGTWDGGETFTVLRGHEDFFFLQRTFDPFHKINVYVYDAEHKRQTGEYGPLEEIDLCQISRPLTESFFGPQNERQRRMHRGLERSSRLTLNQRNHNGQTPAQQRQQRREMRQQRNVRRRTQ